MKSVIIGAGTYGEVYLSYLRDAGVDVAGFLDDNEMLHGVIIQGVPVLGSTDLIYSLKQTDGIDSVYCPIGNNRLRVKFLSLAKSLGYKTPCYIHPSVVMSSDILLGNGVYILLGTHIMPYVNIKDFVMISMGVNIAHHSTLEEGTFISTGVNYGASICAKKNCYIGIGSTIMTGVKTLGEDCLIGAGAVVIKDVPDRAVMAGVPAKVLRIKD